jgi:tetratricopeptide (TPR) repeat protein
MPSLATTLEAARGHHRDGDPARAEELCRAVLRADPHNAEAALLLGAACQAQGRPAEALAHLQQALHVRPHYAEAHHALALVRAAQGDVPAALEGLRQALRLKPDYAEAHHNLGVTLARQRQLDEAVAAFRQAVRCKPDYAAAFLKLAHALVELGRTDEAISAYRSLLRLRPDDAAAQNALGLLLAKQARPAEAAEAFRRALQLDARPAAYHNNLGAALAELGRPAEALGCFEQAVRLQPDHAEAHKSRAMTWLQLGEFARGWAEYEWRWRCQDFAARPYRPPAWDGAPLDGCRVLLHTEQGLGDTLQFIRYAPLVRQRGGVVIVACPPALVPLLRTCPGVAQVVAHGGALPEFDCHAALLSLPRLLGTTLATVPADVPYLAADPGLVERWRRELTAVRGFKVGVVWQGSPGNGADYRRSFPLASLAPLAAVPGVELFSLQKGRGAEQLAEATGRFRVTDLGSRLDLAGGAFTGTAAAMCGLDLIVSCDTASAHLAGALGVPVWVALSYAADWRWLLGREDSPWYPTMRLFRQPGLGNWAAVFGRMAAELRRLLAGRRAEAVLVEVSPGELIDRITALEIRRERAADEAQRAHLHAQLDDLRAARDRELYPSDELTRLTAELRAVNEALWQAEEDIWACERAGDFGPRFVELARSVSRHGDERAALKRQLNERLGGSLSEQRARAGCESPREGPGQGRVRQGASEEDAATLADRQT